MSPDLQEFTNCPDVVRRARNKRFHGRYAFLGGTGSPGRTFKFRIQRPPCPTARQEPALLEVQANGRAARLRLPNQCKRTVGALSGQLEAATTTLQPDRLVVRFYLARPQLYYFRLWVGRTRVERGWLYVEPVRRGIYKREFWWGSQGRSPDPVFPPA